MKTKTRPIPKGYHAVTPYLSVQGAASAIAFYKKAFGAKEIMRMPGPGGTIGHAEIQIGDSRIMLADEFPEMNFRSPRSVGGSPVNIHLYVPDVDKVVKRRSRPVRNYCDRWRTSSTAPAPALWKTPSGTSGMSQPTLRTFR